MLIHRTHLTAHKSCYTSICLDFVWSNRSTIVSPTMNSLTLLDSKQFQPNTFRHGIYTRWTREQTLNWPKREQMSKQLSWIYLESIRHVAYIFFVCPLCQHWNAFVVLTSWKDTWTSFNDAAFLPSNIPIRSAKQLSVLQTKRCNADGLCVSAEVFQFVQSDIVESMKRTM